MDAWEAARNALECALEAKRGESIVIFCDEEKKDVGKVFGNGALNLDLHTRSIQLKTHTDVFRKEVPTKILKILTNQTSTSTCYVESVKKLSSG